MEKTSNSEIPLHPMPDQKRNDRQAKPDVVRDRDWPTAAFTPEDMDLNEKGREERAGVESAKTDV